MKKCEVDCDKVCSGHSGLVTTTSHNSKLMITGFLIIAGIIGYFNTKMNNSIHEIHAEITSINVSLVRHTAKSGPNNRLFSIAEAPNNYVERITSSVAYTDIPQPEYPEYPGDEKEETMIADTNV